jgi:hypothetical protein
LAHTFRCFQRIDLTHGQAEVARYALIVLGNDKGPGRATGLRLASVAQKPVVQRGLSTVETVQPV